MLLKKIVVSKIKLKMVVMSKEKFDYFINGEKDKYEVIIGLEVHAQVQSNSKLFSGSSTKFGAESKQSSKFN